MSDLLDKAKDKLGQKLNKDAQPGNPVEGKADNTVNNDINQAANQAGVPQQDDSIIDKVADAKTNSKIPFGNN